MYNQPLMRAFSHVSAMSAALVCLVAAGAVHAQAPRPESRAFALTRPIPFHGAQLIGFERGAALKTSTGLVRPSDPALVFVTIKLELSEPFEYERGRFREVTLTDESGHVYLYRGWLTEDGWIQIDGQTDDIGLMEADEYPAILDLHFEVPAAARSLVLHHGAASATLFSLPPK
jgi:hypothetical protein